jgi:hypothetical protein
VDTDEKKKDHFMIDLSTKLHERMMLNTEGTFLELVNNVMIMDNAIRVHKETKKRNVVAAPSGSAPLKYRTMYHHGPTYPPRQPWQHRPLRPPLAPPASTVVALATSLESAPRRRRMPRKATSLIHHVVRRRWSLQRPAASTTLPWRIFLTSSKSSRVRFL